ncbi:lectin like domain-containing protein [Aminiphilus circumscriptus]|uniref:lectin like domain-containing protein n=1 Tax=Aminiphilus circumscriptus TaxID=290732 RepID=UPI0004785280|nr:lectin like domain-containing protein [Aminiphilus circumscriptus]
MRNRIGASLLLFSFLTLLMFPTQPSFAETPFRFAPQNPAFLKWQAAGETETLATRTAGEHGKGYVPSPVNLRHITTLSETALDLRVKSLPASYDLRNVGGTSYVTAVRDQGAYGTCWAFAALGSVESNLLKNGEATLDLSERHHSWFGYSDEDTGTVTLPAFTCDAPCDPYNMGGDSWRSVALVARGTGPVLESDDPYSGLPGAATSRAPRVRVRDALYLPIRNGSSYNIARMKQALMTYGALSVAVYMATADPDSWNSVTNALYVASGGSEDLDHQVLVVGWDDAFPKENFGRNTPASDGAWLIKNSWGSAWGNAGYFWLSYEDAPLNTSEVVAYVSEPATHDITIYQYDPLGWVGQLFSPGFSTAWFANIFTATSSEPIREVAFYTDVPNTTYEIDLYTGVMADDPVSGTRVSEAHTAGTLAVPGYRTIPLAHPISLAAGEKFSVVVKLATPGCDTLIPVEYSVAGYSDKATAQPGQSFVSTTGTGGDWDDLTTISGNANVCLKAFAGTGSTTPTLTPGPGGSGGGGCVLGGETAGALLLALPLLLLFRRR